MTATRRFPWVAIVVVCLVGALLPGCAGQPKSQPPGLEVKCPAEIAWQITPEAQVTEFACALGDFADKPALNITLGVKNVADKPLRFRANIFLLDLDKAVGQLLPLKGKPPVIEPGKVETAKLPFMDTDAMSKKMLVVVKTLSE